MTRRVAHERVRGRQSEEDEITAHPDILRIGRLGCQGTTGKRGFESKTDSLSSQLT
jgi:hypothetical protein